MVGADGGKVGRVKIMGNVEGYVRNLDFSLSVMRNYQLVLIRG